MANKTNKKDKKLLMADLAQRIEQGQKDRVELHQIYSEELGACLPVVKKPMNKILDFMDEYKEEMSLKEMLVSAKEFIYEHVPMLHSEELQKEKDLEEPWDIVDLVFHDNFMAMQYFMIEIFKLYGINDFQDKIKNA